MKEVLKQNLAKQTYDFYNFNKQEIVLEELKKLGTCFVLHQVTPEQFEKLKNKTTYDSEDLLCEYPQISGYHDGYKDNDGHGNFKRSGGLKLSNNTILGSFIIEKKRIIYNPKWRFFEERDSFIYSYGFNSRIYTTMSMEELLKDEFQKPRDCLLYLGMDKIPNTYRFSDSFEKVNEEELLSYATDIEKGQALIKRMKIY